MLIVWFFVYKKLDLLFGVLCLPGDQSHPVCATDNKPSCVLHLLDWFIGSRGFSSLERRPEFCWVLQVMTSKNLILFWHFFFLPSIFLSISVFSNESVLCIRWPNCWDFSFSISPSNEYSGLISFKIDWLISLQFKGLSRVFSNTTVQKYQFSGLSFLYGPTLISIHTWLLEKPQLWLYGPLSVK